MKTDGALLREYTETRAEPAFTELVRRLRLSYSAEPLSRVQEDQLIDLINRVPWNRDVARDIGERRFPSQVVADAARILSPAQWQALQKFAGSPPGGPSRFSPGTTTKP
jgi:hypothetical protein